MSSLDCSLKVEMLSTLEMSNWIFEMWTFELHLVSKRQPINMLFIDYFVHCIVEHAYTVQTISRIFIQSVRITKHWKFSENKSLYIKVECRYKFMTWFRLLTFCIIEYIKLNSQNVCLTSVAKLSRKVERFFINVHCK